MADTDKIYTSIAAERKLIELIKAEIEAGGGGGGYVPTYDSTARTITFTGTSGPTYDSTARTITF